MSIPMKNRSPRPLKELVSCGGLVILAFLGYWLAITQRLTPTYMFLMVSSHFIILSLTRFNEQDPPAWLHFNRSWEGLILVATPISALGYVVTWLLGATPEKAYVQACMCVSFFYFMFLTAVFASVTVVGIYFAARAFWYWDWFLKAFPGSYIPFMCYPGVMIVALMGLGTWYTHWKYLVNALSGKEDYGTRTEEYRRGAMLGIIISISIGIILILNELTLFNWLLTNLVLKFK